MSENKERKQPNHHHHHHHLSTPPDDQPDQESSADNPQQPQVVGVPTVDPFLSVPSAGAPGSFDQPHKLQFEAVNPKRPRYTATQWKPISSPSPQKQSSQTNVLSIAEATSSPTTQAANVPPIPPHCMPASSSDTTASSPSHSPRPSSGQDATKPEEHQQFRKGKYVSPVWKPNEMLWLARAWRVQYHGGTSSSGGGGPGTAGGGDVATTVRGKSRGDKDREVAEFLNRHGVNRDAKTAGTKWDNMLGEFRKVYEWERGGEREQVVGKSYFRLSPFERKLRRLPASFDEEVFEELSQFMGSRMRTSHNRGTSSYAAAAPSGGDDGRKPLAVATTSFPPLLREEELSCSGKQIED